MSLPPLAIRIFLEVLVIVAAIWDIRTRRIPNWLTLSGVVLGVALNTFLFEINGLWFSLKGLGVAFGVYFVLYLLRAMGAGDVKLMAAVGAAAGADLRRRRRGRASIGGLQRAIAQDLGQSGNHRHEPWPRPRTL